MQMEALSINAFVSSFAQSILTTALIVLFSNENFNYFL